MKTVIKTTQGVAVMSLVDGADELRCVNEFKSQFPGLYVSHRNMEDSAIPSDREFRGAWVDDTPEAVIDIDMAKAREIQRQALRSQRKPRLEQLDIEYMQADEAGDESAKSTIAASKQALRDVTQHAAIEAATTIEDLKAATLEALIDS